MPMTLSEHERLRLLRIDVELALQDLEQGLIASARRRLTYALEQEFAIMTDDPVVRDDIITDGREPARQSRAARRDSPCR